MSSSSSSRRRAAFLVALCTPRAVLSLLPEQGIVRGKVHIVPTLAVPKAPAATTQIVVPHDGEAWGDGTHPSTALCLDYLSERRWDHRHDRFLDYGCGSGVLLLAAARLGAHWCTGVDIDDEILACAQRNAKLNVVDHVDFRHARDWVPGEHAPATICVANILVGQLSRPSMVATLALGVEPGGELVLSGIRPGEQTALLRRVYGQYFEFDDASYAELEPDDHGREYWGRWARLVGRRRPVETTRDARRALFEHFSDAALL
mmetsp:Transcript_11291/g.45719  ORF Transcript_11291/g.45719 Transcript_11291/m.45719 type:complete len:261 (-) Transcript_11291:145-927(-)|eukprot:CAMPEP_0185701218 /NCGR_PEP_ID=MMETSP1164-20130828/8895_1 /TAXON_ID=1104430 /ORGANISM="Chrysoreinhardia sp, Strain CCMP2950" /LENGTH=260 /DNA_ID=CAMNT_0028368237 /DNA_START=114 /DNA_END=896 /DNA_ORIENTATION=+